jgi:uncharacterized protein YbjT (DUF2867 family)
VGAHLVEALRRAGHEPAVLARSTGVDLVSGKGLVAAVEGAQVVVDVSNVETVRRAKAEAFFETTTTHLVEAMTTAGVGHLVVLSIVGCDRVDLGYYFGKRRQEHIALSGPVPASVLRTTQFHEFPGQLVDRGPGGPFVAVPRWRTQPIAAREVADALLDISVGSPAGMAPELAGPEVHDMADLVRMVLRSRSSRRAVVTARLPGGTGRALADGATLPDGPGPRGTQTFAEWLGSSLE